MIDIKDIQGNVILSVPITKDCKKEEELMVSDYIQLSWNSDSGDEIPVGSYIEYNGEFFYLKAPYKPNQKNELEFTYTPKFDSKVSLWSGVPFFFYSKFDGAISKEPDWSLTSNPADFMKCVCESILNETGEEWTYTVDASLIASASLSFNSSDIFSALNSIAGAFETEWWVDKRNKVIHLEKASYGVSAILSVGENINTPSVNNAREGYYTRFYAFGSTRNITQDYKGSAVNNLVNKRLTLDPVKYPNGYKDIRDGLADGEIISKILIFDDVYPSSKLSISDVRNRLMYRLDSEGNKIKVGTDNDGNAVYDQYAIWYFRIDGFDFDVSNIIEGYNLSVKFQSGSLQGYEFELKYHEDDSTINTADGMTFKVNNGDYEILFQEENNMIIPSLTGLVPSDGDKVVLFNIKMPDEYKQSAYDELEAELDKEIARMTSDLNNYSFNSNPVSFSEKNPNLTIGRNVTYVNGSYSYNTRVIKLSTQLDFPIEQNITIGNEKVKGNTQQLKEEVASANKDLNLLAVFNDMTNSLQQSYARTQQMMLDGFAAIKDMWILKEDSLGNRYIFSKFHVGVQHGITMYAQDGSIYIPTIAEGLPFDGRTIWFNPTTGQIEVIGGTGGGEGVSNFWDLSGIPSWITNTKPTYSYSEIQGTPDLSKYALASDIPSLSGYATEQWVLGRGYALSSDLSALTTKVNDFLEGSDTDNIINKWKELESFLEGLSETDNLATILGTKADKTYVDSTFVTIAGTEDVTGVHNFVNGLMIGGMKLFKSQDDVVYLDGNLVVRGGVTMYALDKVTVDSIIENLPTASTSSKGIASFDSTFFTVDANGKVSIIPDSVGLNEVELDAYLTQYKYATHDWVTSQGYLKEHQTIHSLTIKRNGIELGVYTPNSSAKDVDIIVPTKVSDLDNDSKFINGITSTMVTGALGYTPYNAASFTNANIKSTLGISDWALATNKPSYKTSEVSEETNLYFTNARAVSALKSITDGLATDIATKWTQDDSKIINWDTAFGWGDHSKNDYTTNKYVNDTFVTIGGTIEQTITGDKNFTGKLKVNGGTITYSSDGYWKLEGDLIVTGGVSMYSNDTPYVASTIMDALSVDGTNLRVIDGVLTFVGSTGGGVTNFWALDNIPSWITENKPTYTLGSLSNVDSSVDDVAMASVLIGTTDSWFGMDLNTFRQNLGVTSTIGNLSNVGSWADSVASQDRIMYQAANSSQWVAKNLSDLAVGGVVGDYLPLSGGTITNSSAVPLTINANNDGQVGLFLQSKGNNKTYVGWDSSRGTCLYEFASDSSLNILNGVPRFNTNTLWHSGNFTPSNYLPLSGGTLTGNLIFGIENNTSYYDIDLSRNGNFIKISNASYKLLLEYKYQSYATYHGLMVDEYGAHYTQRTDLAQAPTKYTLWHSGNLTPSNYLPLAGGTIESEKNFPLTIKRNNAYGVGISFANTNETISIQAYNGVLSRIDNSNNGYTIWDSGNDGSGSGLDADLLDGLDATAFFCDKGASNSFDDKIYNGAYRTSSFKPNDAYGYGLVASFRSMETCAQIYFPDNNREPQFRMQWNSQTGISRGWTGLVTAASIGNYNAGSATRIQAYTHDSGDKVLLSGTRSDNTYERCIYDNGYGLMLKRSLTNTVGYIATINDNVASATKLYTARTIWGQSFDGTGNVSGFLENANFIMSNNNDGYFVGNRKDGVGSSDGGLLLFSYGGNPMSFFTNSSERMRIAPTGNVGIGTTSPSQKLHVAGNILTTGGITMYSARKLKTIQDERGLSLEELLVIKPTRFTWKDGRDNKVHIGGIADDVQKVLPEVIYKADNDTLTMDYGNAAFAIAASLIKPVVNHEERIRLLEEENKRLKEEVECLKLNVA